MEDIAALIKRTASGEPPVISLRSVKELAGSGGLSQLEIEKTALASGVIPERYERNIGTLGIEGQAKLLDACMGICGLGGLGGHIVELLARYGAGHLILVDGDVFNENNLNRQILCTEADLGRAKAGVAAERAAAINSSIRVTTHQVYIDPDNVASVFGEAQVVIDALDSVSCRLDLEEGCRQIGIPLVHGAIAGHCGQVMTVFPGGPGSTRSPAALQQIIKSITEKIFPLPDDTQIYPGHGDSTLLRKEKEEFAIFSSRSHDPNLFGDVLWLSS